MHLSRICCLLVFVLQLFWKMIFNIRPKNAYKSEITACVFLNFWMFYYEELNSQLIRGEASMAWIGLGLMQPTSIFITPTSCVYDILNLPQRAKSPLNSPSRSNSHSLCFPSCSLTHSLSLVISPSPSSGFFFLLWTQSSSSSAWTQRPHYLDTLCEFCQPRQSVWGRSKPGKANAKRLSHYITCKRSSSS